MGLEIGTHINDLDSANPLGSDNKSQGDDHIRLIKSFVKATFPGMAGAAFRVQANSAGYTPVVNDNTSILNCTAGLTLSLTAAATLGNQWLIFVLANGGAVTVDPNGAETVNGNATQVIPDGAMAVLVCNGTTFFMLLAPVALTATALTLLDDASTSDMLTTLGAQADLAVPSQAEAEAGTATTERVWTAERVKQAIAALGGGIDRHEVYIDAEVMTPEGGTNPPLTRQQTSTGPVSYETRDFDQTTVERVQFQVRSPENWDIGVVAVEVLWTALAGSGDVVWEIDLISRGNDDAIGLAWPATTLAFTDTLITTEDLHIIGAAATNASNWAGTPTVGDMVFFRIRRNAATGGDTLNADANLIGVRVKFTTTA